MAELQKSEAVTFKKTEAVDPSFRFLRLYQQTGGTTKTIDNNSGSEMVFELPVQCMGLDGIELCMTLTLTDGGENNYNRLFAGCCPLFTQVQLYTRSGVYLMDNRDNQFINNTLGKADTSFGDFMTTSNRTWGLSRCDEEGNGRYNGSALAPNYTDIDYFTVGAVHTADVFKFKIPLKYLCPSSILALNKIFYAGEVILLRFVWNTLANIQIIGTNATNPQTGVGAAAGSIAASDIQLRIPVVTNQDLISSIVEKANSAEGYNLLTPYVHSFRQDLTASTSQTVSVRLNRAHGSHLLRYYHSMMLTTQSDAAEVYLAASPTSYYTALDNERIQQFDLVHADMDDYEYHRTMLSNTCIQIRDMYDFNWFHCDSFDGRRQIEKRKEIFDKNIVCGLPLDHERKIDVVMTTANSAYTHRIHAVCLRNVNVSKSGISIL